ncbi:hypothetical protein ES702_05025 [subsurface metagenome]
MVDDHEDYHPGEAPMAHKASHEDEGSDEISIAGLSGESIELASHKILPSIHHVKFTAAEARAAINNIFGADGKADVDIDLDTHKLINVVDPVGDQDADTKKARETALTTHAALPTIHQNAPNLIETHRLDVDAHHGRYTNGEAQTVADARILIHKNIATAHQDAPTLIENHRLVPGAHHAKYTDAEARAVYSPISIPAAAFMPRHDTYNWSNYGSYLMNRTDLTSQSFTAPVFFPPGVTVTKVVLYGYRNDADAILSLALYRIGRDASATLMSNNIANWIDEWNSIEDTTIIVPTIDNVNYSYVFILALDPDVSVLNVRLNSAKIEFTG